jgi:hypothetical protein
MTRAPACYTKPRALTPNIRLYMLEQGWIDRRTVTRIERPTPEAAALAYRIRQLEDAPSAGVDVTG